MYKIKILLSAREKVLFYDKKVVSKDIFMKKS
jgi:hypothetical protein